MIVSNDLGFVFVNQYEKTSMGNQASNENRTIVWEEDDAVSECLNCKKTFSVTIRKVKKTLFILTIKAPLQVNNSNSKRNW